MSQVKIQGNASGTGVFTVAAPNSSTNRTLTLPDNTGTLLSSATTTGFPAGSVLQVVHANYNAWSPTTSTSFIATGLSGTITPSSTTSKILVQINANGVYNSSTSNAVLFYLYKNGSFLDYLDYDLGNNILAYGISGAYQYLDSPASTSALTYALYYASNTGSTIGINNYTSTTNNKTRSSITLLEIAA